MQNTFDPYHQWLGIPRDEQPPHHYRLLAVRIFEADPNVIDNAADRIMMHLRSLSLGPNGALAQKLLNEVAAARVTLLDPDQRGPYDNRLTALLSPPRPVVPLAPATPSPPLALRPLAPAPLPAAAAPAPMMTTDSRPLLHSRSLRGSPRKSNGAYEIAKVVAGGLVGLIIAQALLFYALNIDIFGVMGRLHGKNNRVAPPATARNPSIVPPVKSPPANPNSPPAFPWTQTIVPQPLPVSSTPSPAMPAPPLPPAPVPSPSAPPSGPTSLPPEIGGPTPLRPADALGRLPRGVELPSQLAADPRQLVPLGVAEIPELELTCLHAAIPKETAFVLEKVEARNEWVVQYRSKLADASPVSQEIARLFAKENGIWYQWGTSPTDQEIRRQMSNCHLHVKWGGAGKGIALRESRKTAPLMIDVSKALSVQVLELSDLPDDKSLAIRFGELGRFSRGAIWKNGKSSAPLGKTVTIEFSQAAGARLDLSLTKKSSTTLTVTMRPIFLEQKQPREMTLARVAELESDLPRGIAKDRNSLQGYRGQYSTLERDLASAQRASASNMIEITAKQQRVTRISGELNRVGSRILSLERQIAQNQARLKNLPEMRGFLEELHQKAAVNFTVESGSGADALVLMEPASP
jgi:hypothetical protein